MLKVIIKIILRYSSSTTRQTKLPAYGGRTLPDRISTEEKQKGLVIETRDEAGECNRSWEIAR
jgi:hypothetical protein